MEALFTEIFKRNLWGSSESVSGPGSTVDYTENLRSKLPELCKAFSIKSIFDAPCGDLNWMRLVLPELDVRYIGGDIVKEMVDAHQARYGSATARFIHIDLSRDDFPEVDLMISRDFLFHMSYQDTLKILDNFSRSNTKYLLTTTHKDINLFHNADIKTGNVRLIDLFSAPYNFPREVKFRIEDWRPPFEPREMCLWSREQVIAGRNALHDWLARRDASGAGRQRPASIDPAARAASDAAANLRGIAALLLREGHAPEALTLLEYLAGQPPADSDTLLQLARLLRVEDRTLDAIARLIEYRAAGCDADILLEEIRLALPGAIERFNKHLASGEVIQAERYAAALAELIPRNRAILEAGLSCNIVLNRPDRAGTYARALLIVDPGHAAARAALAPIAPPPVADDIGQRVERALALTETHPLVQLRDLHDAASAILCRRLSEDGIAQVARLQATAGSVAVNAAPGSELEAWENHYRAMLGGIDLGAVVGPTPPAEAVDLDLATSAGNPLTWAGLKGTATRQRAAVVFLAAADQAYVDLYGRWYVRSILKNCDVPCLVVLHVIGGAGRLGETASSLGIRDPRLILAGDRFDPASVTARCYDAPPKGLIAKPVAHLQSVRFMSLGTILERLGRPVFVSDIDLLLQRGVADLLESCAGFDVVFNENAGSPHAGSRLTANLLLANPTANAGRFQSFLQAYLRRALSGASVSRWIDQLALLMARHHLMLRGEAPRLGHFDTASDINNVMYRTYQQNPFRFLSLYHGFDTASLSVLDEEATPDAPAAPAKTARVSPRRPRRAAAG